MDGCEVEYVLPGCIWSRPRPEELKELNVIIRAVGEPSSNHTQITYTLTPTYNTSHSGVCVCVSALKKGGSTDWRNERKMKDKKHMSMQKVCILCQCKKCALRQACGHSVSIGNEWRQEMCVLEKRVYFFSLFFLPPSLHVSLISPPSIFHFYMQLQMWRQWNIKLLKWACFCTLTT